MPVLTPGLSSLWIGLVTPVDAGVARPAGRGPLASRPSSRTPSGMELFDLELTPMDEAMERAIAEGEDSLG